MQLYRQDGLGQVHVVIGVQNGIGHGVGQIVAVIVAAAQQYILGECPRTLAYVEEHQKMLKQGGGLLPGAAGYGPVRLKNAISIAHGKGKGVGRLLQTHHLPQDQIGLHGLHQVLGTEFRHAAQIGLHQLQLLPPLGSGGLGLLAGQIGVAVGQRHGAFQRLAHGGQIIALPGQQGGVLSQLAVDGGDAGGYAILQGRTEVRDQMASHLLKEESDLIGVFAVLAIDLTQRLYARGPGGGLPHGGDPLGGDLLRRGGIVIHLQRVTVAPEGLYLKSGIDQRIAGGKGVPLGTCQ